MLFGELFSSPVWDIFLRGVSFLFNTTWVWLPIVLIALFWKMWMAYLHTKTNSTKEWVMLEVRLPQELPRSPLAMELFLNALHDKGSIGNFVKKYWDGNLTPWTSLEIVSIEGSVHFFIRAEKKFRKVLESQLYAQYPDAEVIDVEDYTDYLVYDEDKYSLDGGEVQLTMPDPYPIKTYVDYGLDKDPKEELKVDPMTPMLEWLGSLGKGEQVWIQILVRYHLDNRRKSDKWFDFKDFGVASGRPKWKGGWFAKEDAWKKDAEVEIEKIKKKATVGGDDENEGKIALTPGQRDTIAAIERSTSKNPFDVGIRGLYIGEQDVFDKGNMGGLWGSFRSFSSGNLNGFKPGTNRVKTGFEYPWQDPFGTRSAKKKRKLFDAYRRRSYFYPPYKRKPMVLNTEELATIYHFPGRIATTPTFKRIPSRKAEPPTDIPL